MRTSQLASRSPAGDLPEEVLKQVEFTEVGLVLDPALSISSWTDLMAHLGRVEARIPWWIGDALAFGQHTYGSKYADAVEATGRSLQTLKNYAWVARSVPVENRDPNLPWRLYREVARLDPAQQREWIAQARDETWTADDLRRELTAASNREQGTPDFDPVPADDQGQLDRVMVKCPKCDHRFET
jgi:hypothetical protein